MFNNTELKINGCSNEWINWIEDSITKKTIKYYDYKYFNNIQKIGIENLGKIYHANWKNSYSYLTLKSFNNFNTIVKEIVNEIKLQHEMDFHENIIRFYGITTENQSDNSKKYFLVMEYADSGTLRNYLSERFEILTWNDKLNLALQLANVISFLHNKEIVHRGLHSNNILVHKNIIKLADFGLSKRILVSSKELFDMVTYIDPQIFNEKRDSKNQLYLNSLNKKSDVYGIGILLWEISSGRLPFCSKSYDFNLAMEILQGLREKPIPNTPEDYIKIYTDCWNNNPDNRPTINQVVIILNAIILNENTKISNKQQNIIELPENIINNSLFRNYCKINIKEIEPSISSNLIIKDFELMVIEIIFLLENVEVKRKKPEVINYLKNHNTTTREIYNWLLNNQDTTNSVFLLGVFYHFGIEIDFDKQKAFEFYQKASNKGHAPGITSLANCYSNGIGIGVNRAIAFELYHKAASLGNSRGINNLGYCYEEGIGTNIDTVKAFELYQESANLGNALGISSLGYCYDNGIGTSIDRQKAFELYQNSANSGNIFGMSCLGYYYEKGIETSVNEQKAFELYHKAANLGDSFSQYNLAFLYENGKGVKKNINQAIYWYDKCAEQGDQDAQAKLNELNEL